METTQREAMINRVLVSLFNDLLRLEEDSLRRAGVGALTMREIHTLEAVCAAEGTSNDTMTALADRLRVTVGSLTVAVATLVRKGYLVRIRSEKDRRLVHVAPTDAARQVEAIHRAYHREMTQRVIDAVPPDQLDALLMGLQGLCDYFYGQEEKA